MSVIATFPKRPGEEFRISVEEFQGQKRVNIRVWWQDDFGEWRPGKMGLSLTPVQFRAMWGACVQIDETLKAEGL